MKIISAQILKLIFLIRIILAFLKPFNKLEKLIKEQILIKIFNRFTKITNKIWIKILFKLKVILKNKMFLF